MVRSQDYLTDCPQARGAHRSGVCFGCAGPLPKGRRRWCSDDCLRSFERSHYWNAARPGALYLSHVGNGGDPQKAYDWKMARCARCGSDGRRASGRCMCSTRWPCGRAEEVLWPYEGQVVTESTARHEQTRDRVLEVNHIVPRNGRGYEPGCHHHQDGLEVLCRRCHVEETRRQMLGRKFARFLRVMIDVRRGRLVVVPRIRHQRRIEARSLPIWTEYA